MPRRTQLRFALRTPTPAWRRALAALAALLGVACSDGPTPPPDESRAGAPVTVSASLTASQLALISALSVEVTGPGIAAPVVANVPVTGATVNGTVTVPAGAGRVFTVHAFDASGVETYRGTATANVQPGANVTLGVTLLALTGGTPIAVTVTTLTISIAPAVSPLRPGQTVTLTATVRDAGGVVNDASDIQWGTSNPLVVSVAPRTPSTSAVLTAGVADTATVVASYRGIAASVAVRVLAESVTAVAAGSAHSCALGVSGTVYCWGSNGDGQLGDGTTVDRATPAPVSGTARYVAITAGSTHSCALTTAGEARCWGANGNGALGDGSTALRQTTPTPVAGTAAYAAIAAGGLHSCALRSDGAAYCWGLNAFGQVGDGTGRFDQGLANDRHVPTAVAGGLRFTTLAAGANHSCAVTPAGTAYCWGRADAGQIGTGQTSDPSQTAFSYAAPTAVAGGTTFAAIAAGEAGSCGLTSAGAAHCWGGGFFGTLGDGGTADRSVPGPVAGGLTFSTLALGRLHACGLTTAGAAHCWGRNEHGELGNGTTTDRSAPVAVSGAQSFTSLAAGYEHACAVTAAGELRCWGRNARGQLGDGSRTDRLVPTPVVFP